MAKYQVAIPYVYDDEPFFNQFECLRNVWMKTMTIKSACEKFSIKRSSYYELEKRFTTYGLPGLLFFPDGSN